MYKLFFLALVISCIVSCSKEDHSLPMNELSGTRKYIGEKANSAGAYFLPKDSVDYYFRFAPDTYLRQRGGARTCGSYFYSKGTLTLRIGKTDSSSRPSFLMTRLYLDPTNIPKMALITSFTRSGN